MNLSRLRNNDVSFGTLVQSLLCLFLLLAVTIVFAEEAPITNDPSLNYGLQKGAVSAAKVMLNRSLGDWEKLKRYDKPEIAKRLTALVYNYCSPISNLGVSSNNDINNLFSVCNAACAGNSYVLRGLLAVYGIHANYMNLYNLPIQGNHTAVQADINKQPVFLDPTYGVFFTTDGDINSLPASLPSVRYDFTNETIARHVFQALPDKDFSRIDTMPLAQLYNNKYRTPKLLRLDSYINSETFGTVNDSKTLFLSANLYFDNNRVSLGCVNSKNIKAASACLLNETNALYNNQKLPSRYISYDISQLGYILEKQPMQTMFHFHGMVQGAYYQVKLLLYNPNNITRALSIGTLNGLNLAENSQDINIKPGLLIYDVKFKARQKDAYLVLYPKPEKNKWSANFFAIQVVKKDS